MMVLSLFACATVGKNFAGENVPKIKIGQTHKSDLNNLFGQPWRVGIEDGNETWTYGYYQYKLIGETLTKDLVIRFGPDNIVKSYSFNETAPKNSD